MSTLLLIWHALSPLAVVAGVGGLAIMAVVFFGMAVVPAAIRRWVFVSGILLLIVALIYEGGFAKATLAAEKRKALEIALANQHRAEAAESATDKDKARAAADATTIEAMRKQIDETPRNAAPALPRDVAGRVRRIR